MILLIAGSLLTAVLLVNLIQNYIKWSKLPNGPTGLPVVGYAPFLGKKPYETLLTLSTKYGPVFRLATVESRFSVEPNKRTLSTSAFAWVIVNGWEHLKECLSNPALLGRPKDFFGESKTQNIGAGSGILCKEQRRLSFRILHELGFGKQRMENYVKDELHYFVKEIEKNANTPYDINSLLSSSVSNNVSYLLFGHRFDYGDPVRKAINACFVDFQANFTFLSQFTFQFTFFACFLKVAVYFNLFGARKVAESFEFTDEVVVKEIKEHEKTLDESNIRDYIDGYLVEIKKRQTTNNILNFTLEALKENIDVFFGAGSNTVKDTLMWLFLYTANREDIQKKVQEEIDSVVGRERPVSWADRTQMPYTCAVISETERLGSVFPLNLPRRALEDTKIGEQFIPKDTLVMFNFWSLSRDPNLWTEPNKFDPTRFLSEDGKELKKFEHHVPFSAGQRSCAGEMLARCELFLYLTTILENFDMKLPDGVQPNFDGTYGICLKPKTAPTYVFIPRK